MPNRFDDFTGAVGAPIMQTPTTGDADPITARVNTGVATDPFQMGNTSVVQSGMGDMNNIVQDALRNYSTGIQQQRSAQMQQLGTIESGMFDQMGRAQLASERDIANRRMQALRSGMPSSQLAALELQNVQTAQLGAQQMAQQYDDIRMQLGTELAGAESMMAGDLTRELLQGRVDMEAIDAQRFTADTAAQMRAMFPNWDSMTNLEKMQAVQALSGVAPDAMIGDPSRFASGQQTASGEGTVVPPTAVNEQGVPVNAQVDESGQPIINPETGAPYIKWEAGRSQTQQEKSTIREEYLIGKDGVNIASIRGDRLWSVNELTSASLGIGSKPGEVGSNQTNWINLIKDRALEGAIKPGDIIDFNHGLGENWYVFTGDGFIDIKLNRIIGGDAGSTSPFKRVSQKNNSVWTHDGSGLSASKLE